MYDKPVLIMKTYLSGRITGIEHEAKNLFERYEMMVEGDVVNPFNLNHDHDRKWSSYMKECIKALMDCDKILMLPGWEDSEGAKLELMIAEKVGIMVEYVI